VVHKGVDTRIARRGGTGKPRKGRNIGRSSR
jgi:hypothetical protein